MDVEINAADDAGRTPIYAAMGGHWVGIVPRDAEHRLMWNQAEIPAPRTGMIGFIKPDYSACAQMILDHPGCDPNKELSQDVAFNLPSLTQVRDKMKTVDREEDVYKLTFLMMRHPKVIAGEKYLINAITDATALDRPDILAIFLSPRRIQGKTLGINSILSDKFSLYGNCINQMKEKCIEWYLQQSSLDVCCVGSHGNR